MVYAPHDSLWFCFCISFALSAAYCSSRAAHCARTRSESIPSLSDWRLVEQCSASTAAANYKYDRARRANRDAQTNQSDRVSAHAPPRRPKRARPLVRIFGSARLGSARRSSRLRHAPRHYLHRSAAAVSVSVFCASLTGRSELVARSSQLMTTQSETDSRWALAGAWHASRASKCIIGPVLASPALTDCFDRVRICTDSCPLVSRAAPTSLPKADCKQARRTQSRAKARRNGHCLTLADAD